MREYQVHQQEPHRRRPEIVRTETADQALTVLADMARRQPHLRATVFRVDARWILHKVAVWCPARPTGRPVEAVDAPARPDVPPGATEASTSSSVP